MCCQSKHPVFFFLIFCNPSHYNVWLIIIMSRSSIQQRRIQRRGFWPASWRTVRGKRGKRKRGRVLCVNEATLPCRCLPSIFSSKRSAWPWCHAEPWSCGVQPTSLLPGMLSHHLHPGLLAKHPWEVTTSRNVSWPWTTPPWECFYGFHHCTILQVLIICFNSVFPDQQWIFLSKKIFILI